MFFSSPLDEVYTLTAIRYVKRNSIRAGLVERAEDYPWSSVAAHCGLVNNPMLAPFPALEMAVSRSEWSSRLALPEDDRVVNVLRRNVVKGFLAEAVFLLRSWKSGLIVNSGIVHRVGLLIIKGSVLFRFFLLLPFVLL